MALTPEQFINPNHFEGTQEMVVLSLNGFNGKVTPWNATVDLEAAAETCKATLNAAYASLYPNDPSHWTDVFPSYANPGEELGLAWMQEFFSTTPSGAPPEGSTREDVSPKWDPPPPPFNAVPDQPPSAVVAPGKRTARATPRVLGQANAKRSKKK